MKHLRQNYSQNELIEGQIPNSPFTLFQNWFNDAINSKIIEPNAMILSTITNQSPDSRIVLLKDLRDEEFVFYTNYNSNKGLQLIENPKCTLVFPWIELERQVIIRGIAHKVNSQESDDYFKSRPKSSQIGAWASQQSSPITSRQSLDEQLADMENRFKSEPLTRPSHWGGFAIKPMQIEFWQGRPNRLHDRFLFEYSQQTWEIIRLQP